MLSCLTASEKAVKLVQLGRGSGRQRPNKRGLPHLLSNEQREAQGAVRLEFNVSLFLGSLLCIFVLDFDLVQWCLFYTSFINLF